MDVFFSVEMRNAYGTNHVFRVMRIHSAGREEEIGSLCLVTGFPQAKRISNYKSPELPPTVEDTCEVTSEKKPFLFWRREGSEVWKAWRRPTDKELNALSDHILDDNPFIYSDFFANLLPKE